MGDLAARIEAATGAAPIERAELDGGMVGTVYRVDLADGRTVAAKVGDIPLAVEAFMLRYLGERGLPVPGVYHADDDLLVLEFVAENSEITPAVERDAADRLAALHDHSAAAFGFERDTLSGPLRQPNPWTDSWIAFFREHRLGYLTARMRREGDLNRERYDRVAAVLEDLDALLVEPEPALIHGDVWTGNLLAADGAVAAFLDPATYYAHAEVELAYVRFTDTFGEPFFERYREHRGIAPGFDTRADVYNLFPILEHVRLFGGGYADDLDRTLDRLGY